MFIINQKNIINFQNFNQSDWVSTKTRKSKIADIIELETQIQNQSSKRSKIFEKDNYNYNK